MSLAMVVVLCALLVGLIGFGARLCVEADPMDVIALAASCVGIGYMLHFL